MTDFLAPPPPAPSGPRRGAGAAAAPPAKPSQLSCTRGRTRTGRVFLQSLFFQRPGPRPPVLPPDRRGAGARPGPPAGRRPARGHPLAAGQAPLLRLGTEAAASEQNSITPPLVRSFKRVSEPHFVGNRPRLFPAHRGLYSRPRPERPPARSKPPGARPNKGVSGPGGADRPRGWFCAFQHPVQRTRRLHPGRTCRHRISYLHLFQIISFTRDCLCKS